MSNEYKECEKVIKKLLVQEKKLIKQLKEIQKTKIEMVLILAKDSDVDNKEEFEEWLKRKEMKD